jgi:hypothetical protein
VALIRDGLLVASLNIWNDTIILNLEEIGVYSQVILKLRQILN